MIKLANSFRLSQAAKRLPPGRNCRPVSTSTLMRWILHGIIGPDGEIVRLEAARLGSCWVTDESALQTFVERLTPNLTNSTPGRSITARRRGDEHADRELEKRGL